MITVLLIADNIEVTSQFITVQIASNRNELSLWFLIGALHQIVGISFTLLLKLLSSFVALCHRERLRLISRWLDSGAAFLFLLFLVEHGAGVVCRLILRFSFTHYRWLHLLHLLLILWSSLLIGASIVLSEEVNVVCLVHEICLIGLDDRHVLDRRLVNWLFDQALVKEFISLVREWVTRTSIIESHLLIVLYGWTIAESRKHGARWRS